MKLLYNLGITVLAWLVRIHALFNQKTKLFVEGRQNIWEDLASVKSGNIVWFHAASLGEFEQGKPVLEMFLIKNPTFKAVVTFFSPSGYEPIKNYEKAQVFYLPWDTHKNANRLIELIKPKLAVFIRYEIWPNYLDALHKHNIPCTVISAQFRNNQFAFLPFGAFLKRRLLRLDHITVQYESALQVLIDHGFSKDRVSVCGDPRFDRVLQTLAQRHPIIELDAFCENSPTLILGSCYKDEIEFVSEAVRKYPNWKFIYAPHRVDAKSIGELEAQLPEQAVRFTDYNTTRRERILILNTIGMLASSYRYGQIAVVGGGFRDGIHNVLEPASFGMPVFFGPNHHSFPEGQAMIDLGFGYEINKSNRLILHQLMEDAENRREHSVKAKNFVQKHAGATECISRKLQSLI